MSRFLENLRRRKDPPASERGTTSTEIKSTVSNVDKSPLFVDTSDVHLESSSFDAVVTPRPKTSRKVKEPSFSEFTDYIPPTPKGMESPVLKSIVRINVDDLGDTHEVTTLTLLRSNIDPVLVTRSRKYLAEIVSQQGNARIGRLKAYVRDRCGSRCEKGITLWQENLVGYVAKMVDRDNKPVCDDLGEFSVPIATNRLTAPKDALHVPSSPPWVDQKRFKSILGNCVLALWRSPESAERVDDLLMRANRGPPVSDSAQDFVVRPEDEAYNHRVFRQVLDKLNRSYSAELEQLVLDSNTLEESRRKLLQQWKTDVRSLYFEHRTRPNGSGPLSDSTIPTRRLVRYGGESSSGVSKRSPPSPIESPNDKEARLLARRKRWTHAGIQTATKN